jgi:hypothetical protein
VKLFFVIISLYAVGANTAAASTKACFCEVGSKPENQVRAFSLGCSMWLRTQKNCVSKQKVSEGTDYSRLNLPLGTSDVSIGYVGHWFNSGETVIYLQNVVTPLMKQKNVSVTIDNTACKAMENPLQVLDHVKRLRLQDHQSLVIRGNQVNSVGKWDIILGSNFNFYAIVSSITREITYPRCKGFQNGACLPKVQLNEVGTCVDKNGQQAQLRCCKVRKGPIDRSSIDRFAWLSENECSGS